MSFRLVHSYTREPVKMTAYAQLQFFCETFSWIVALYETVTHERRSGASTFASPRCGMRSRQGLPRLVAHSNARWTNKKTTTKTTKGEGVSYLHNAYSAKRDGQTTTGRKRQTRQLRTYTGYVGSCRGSIKNEKNCPDTERVFRSDTYSFREWIKWDATTVIRVLKARRGKTVLWSFETRI